MEETILAAAEELFLDRGFSATSTTEIARRAGCNQALVHYYFRTKDRLFEGIFEKKMREFSVELMRISGEDISFEEKIRKKVSSHFNMIRSNPRLPLLLFTELHSNRLKTFREHISQIPRTALEKFEEELEEEVRAGRVRPMRLSELLLSIISLNVMPFLARPLLELVGDIPPEAYDTMLENRKKENIRIILNSLKP